MAPRVVAAWSCGITPRAWTACVVLLALAGGMISCRGDREQEVVVYTALDDHAARPVLRLFTERTGVRVRPLYDTEVNKTAALAARLRAERERPRADLFWSGEAVHAGRLAAEGILEGGADGLTPTMLRGRVLVFDPARVEREEVPTEWWELSQERYAGRLVMADPRFGSTGGHMAAMYAMAQERGTPERFEAWARDLNRHGVRRLTSGNAGVVRAVAAGEADFGMTDIDDVMAYLAQPGAKSLEYAVLRHGPNPGEGPFLVIGVAGIVTAAPNRKGAQRLLEFLATDEAQRALEEAAPGFFALDAGEGIGLADGLRVDAAAVEAALPRAIEALLGVGSASEPGAGSET
ncbi:MAG: extracellular solute-binding protein [Phycisphaeraceae bacterium]|nr:extracellular solute-binding protein [Phycisphaeraceae bacterium]